MAEDMRRTAARVEPSVSGSWWFVVVSRALVDIFWVLIQLNPIRGGLEPVRINEPLWERSVTYLGYEFPLLLLGLGIIAYAIAVLGLSFDRQYVEAVSGWTPSRWYSVLILVPLLGTVASLLYLGKRNRNVGTP